MVSTRSLLRYPGGKYRARKILEQYVPKETRTLLSPFFGGGSFELFLTGKGINVTAYDAFEVLVVFWRTVQQYPKELSDTIQGYYHHGVDKDIFKQWQMFLKNVDVSSLDDFLCIDIAAKFFIVNRCSFSGATLSGGFSKESSEKRFTQKSIDNIRIFDNPLLEINNGNCFNVLQQDLCLSYDLLFLDPPYFLPKDKNNLYGVAGHLHQDFDHILLYDQICKIDRPFLLTYNNNDFIRDLWKDFDIVDAQWAYGMNNSKQSSEIVIKNY